MPTSYKDQFYTVDPGVPPPVGTILNVTRHTVVDTDDDTLIEPNVGETFDGVQITRVWLNDTLTVNLPGGGALTYTGVTYYLAAGSAVFTPMDGQVLVDGATFNSSTFVTSSTNHSVANFGPTCFTPGTFIDTPDGPRLIEEIKVGDSVQTLDNGAQEVRMILRDRFRAVENFAPICFEKGAIGNVDTLIVSPQHRMLISGWKAELIAGQDEMLVAAKHLVNGEDITQPLGDTVEYIHLVFDDHEVIFGQGVPSESCFPEYLEEAHRDDTQQEILDLFPQLKTLKSKPAQLVRPEMRRFEAQLLAA